MKKKTIGEILDEYIETIIIYSAFFTVAEMFILLGLGLNNLLVIGISMISFFLWYVFWSGLMVWAKRGD